MKQPPGSVQPKITIAIAAYNVSEFIVQAVESTLRQSRPFHEILIFDDASTDDTALKIQHALGASTDQVKFQKLSKNVGLGAVRNLALDMATGTHICFLDGDDWIVPTYCEKLTKQLVLRNAAVTIFNHLRFQQATSRVELNWFSAKLSIAANSGLREKVENAALRNLNVAWNRAVRLDYARAHKFRFGKSFYEDIAWCYLGVFFADDLVILPDKLVFYRNRAGSILNTVNEKHYDALDAWKTVFAALKSERKFEEYGKMYLNAAARQAARVLFQGRRLPANLKWKFFVEMSLLLKSSMLDGNLANQEKNGLQLNAIIAGNILAYWRLWWQFLGKRFGSKLRRLAIGNFYSSV